MSKEAYVYILASQQIGTLYIGVTNDLIRRIWEHKKNQTEGFTKTYHVHHLVYFEQHADISEAIKREKRLKNWPRQWKIDLVEKDNPGWRDLYQDICGADMQLEPGSCGQAAG